MRGAPKTLLRLNAVSAFLAAAALLAFSTVNPTGASAKPHPMGLGTGSTSLTSDSEEAYAIPRNAPSGDVEIVLPQPLPPSAVAQYQRILAMQDEGAFADADRLIARLDDTTLVGPILADRYLNTNYRASSAELLSWYENYNDQPSAASVYQLMQKKLPRASLPLAPPASPATSRPSGLTTHPGSPPSPPGFRIGATATSRARNRFLSAPPITPMPPMMIRRQARSGPPVPLFACNSRRTI
jgi:hypothetical protein